MLQLPTSLTVLRDPIQTPLLTTKKGPAMRAPFLHRNRPDQPPGIGGGADVLVMLWMYRSNTRV